MRNVNNQENDRDQSIEIVEQRKSHLLSRIAGYFIHHTHMTYLFIILLLVLGISSAYLLPKESLPEIVFPTLMIQTPYPGAGALDVEQLVTDPIETALSGMDEVDEMTSQSSEGLSYVVITFLEGVDIQKKELEADSLLGEVDLPDGAEQPDAVIFKTSELPLMTFSVSGPYRISTLSQIASDIADEVTAMPAVDDVTLSGDVTEEIHVVVDEKKLINSGFTFDQVMNALAGSNVDLPVGTIERGGQVTTVSIDNRITDLEAMKNVIVSGNGGQSVYLGELADIHYDIKSQRLTNRTYFKADNSETAKESVSMTVYRKKGADVIGTSADIKAMIEAGRGRLYPKDVAVEIVYDNAVNVKRDLSNIQLSAGSGLMVVIMVLFLFIGLKESLIVAITMPLSLLLTLGLLSYLGISLNTFAILGLIVALGLLVDNAIIVMENMDRLYRMGYTPYRAALDGVTQVALPILASTLTTVAAFFPLSILPGILGAFVNTIPRTIILTLLSSLLISITVTPSIYLVMLKRSKRRPAMIDAGRIKKMLALAFMMLMSFIAFYDPEGAKWLPIAASAFFGSLMALKLWHLGSTSMDTSRLVKWYEKVLSWFIGSPLRQLSLIGVGIIILVGTAAFIPLGILKVNFFPQSEPSSLTVTVDTPGGMTLDETGVVTAEVERILIEEPAVAVFNTAIGGVAAADTATINVTFYDKSFMTEDGFTVLKRLERAFAAIPDAKIEVTVAAQGGPPSGKPIAIELLANDYEAGKGVADQYVSILREIDGVYNAAVSVTDSGPRTVMKIDPIAANQYGLSVSDIARQLNRALNGAIATTLKEGQTLIDVRVLDEAIHKTDAVNLDTMYVTLQNGTKLPLSAVASYHFEQGVSAIAHQDGERIITVTADVMEGYNASEITNDLDVKISAIQMPDGVKVKLSGEVAQIQDSFKDLMRSMILAVLLVFVILTVQFKSVKQPFAILTTVPMAFIGVFSGLVITGNEFGFYAFMGLIALVGIAVNDAIVLIDFMNGLRREGVSLDEAVVEAGKIRFNPVLATTMTTIGGVLPLAFREVYYAQFSFTLVFGLLVTTVMTLYFIPVTYHLIERRSDKKEAHDEV
ncbi:efflux RND transporter permease subunit [Fusibacter paucivorans]|uniref:Efflux RND transporter permease subunit n=1 Tax=Fusibacter paucivorans TaxID=76009 RepID=A0ABS5PPK2_9FIRM|nr:efflux RND transporter permease subunit [Fusibacter paucivorans]MBS7526281.1 efflux RND transporter permease subunit [Fusibacter paucivorans]